MELSAIIISVLSLITTIILAFYNVFNSNKNNEINLNSGFFLQYYNDFLIKKIPLSRNKLYFDNNGRLKDYSELKDYIISFLEKSLCYRYLDDNYYNSLKDVILSLEDYLLTEANKTNCSNSLQQEIYSKIDKKLTKIYHIAQQKYLGR